MKKQGWSVAKVRRVWLRGTVGKATAVLLAIAMVLPAFPKVPPWLVSGGGK